MSRLIVVGLTVLSAGASLARGQASFRGLGQYTDYSLGTFVGDIAADGHTVVGWAQRYYPVTTSVALQWRDGQMSVLASPIENQPYRALAVSRDGSSIAGHTGWPSTYNIEACAWIGDAVYSKLLGGTSINVDISFDGRLVMFGDVLVPQTHIWDPVANTITDYSLSPFVGSRFARSAYTICGYTTCRFTLESLFDPLSQVLVTLPVSVSNGLTTVCNADASVVAYGPSLVSPDQPSTAHTLPLMASDMSDDGQIVVGNRDGVPWVWSMGGGGLPLSCILARFGIDTNGWMLNGNSFSWVDPRVSGDGLTIVGNGTNPQGQPEGWIAHLPFIPHAADFDGTGFVDTDDYDAFVTAFDAGDPRADFDGSGFVDTDDFDAFVRAFEAGC